jgi:hypothetical protein
MTLCAGLLTGCPLCAQAYVDTGKLSCARVDTCTSANESEPTATDDDSQCESRVHICSHIACSKAAAMRMPRTLALHCFTFRSPQVAADSGIDCT